MKYGVKLTIIDTLNGEYKNMENEKIIYKGGERWK